MSDWVSARGLGPLLEVLMMVTLLYHALDGANVVKFLQLAIYRAHEGQTCRAMGLKASVDWEHHGRDEWVRGEGHSAEALDKTMRPLG